MFRVFFILIFLLSTLSIYLFIFRVFKVKGIRKYLLIIFIILSFLACFFRRDIRSIDTLFLYDIFNTLSYSLIGLLIISIVLAFIILVLRTILYFSSKKLYNKYRKKISIAWLTLSILICFYGNYEAFNIEINKIIIASDKLNISQSLKIVHIADQHLGSPMSILKFDITVEKIKKLDPDIIFITGDLFQNMKFDHKYVISKFKSLNPKYGKYFVTGNHDDHFEKDKLKKFLSKSNIKNMDNRYYTIDKIFQIIGISDPGWNISKKYIKNEELLLSNIDKDKFVIYLKHQPIVPNIKKKQFDLMLSGHTHKGQIFPGQFFVKKQYNYLSGLYKLKNSSYLYVTNGTGTWGPPVRILASPEITVIEIIGKK